MATTRVHLGKNLDSAINYVVKGKPKHDNPYIQGKRALMIGAINGASDPDAFKTINDLALKNNPKVNYNSVQCIRTIVSFDPKQLDYRNLKDRRTALSVGKEIALEKYPDNASLVVLQADGKGHKLHDHIITNARQIGSGKSSSPQATFKQTYPITDKVEKEYHLKQIKGNPFQRIRNQTHSTSTIPDEIAERNKKSPKYKQNSPLHYTYSYVKDLHDRILKSYQHAQTGIEFHMNLNNYKVKVRPMQKMRKNKRTGKYEYHFYKHPTPKGTYHKLTDKYIRSLYKTDPTIAKNSNLKAHQGMYLRDKKHNTYEFKDKSGKRRIVRDSKLGKDTSPSYINNVLINNLNQPTVEEPTFQFQTSSTSSNSDSGNGGAPAQSFNTTKSPATTKKQSSTRFRTIKAMGVHKSKHTFAEYVYGVDNDININGIHKPYIHTAHIPEPVMKFHPKSHNLSKAINDLTKVLNRIKNATNTTSDQQKQQMEDAYEDSLLRKDQAEKVNEINNENRAINQKVNQDNYDAEVDYRNQLKAYDNEIRRERYQQFHRYR